MAKRFLQGTINSTPNYINGELADELKYDFIDGGNAFN